VLGASLGVPAFVPAGFTTPAVTVAAPVPTTTTTVPPTTTTTGDVAAPFKRTGSSGVSLGFALGWSALAFVLAAIIFFVLWRRRRDVDEEDDDEAYGTA
jgi:cytochrome oxidase assembly protein ShyY1